MSSIKNLLTVDCEEWFVTETLINHFSRDEWDKLNSTVTKNSHKLLDIFYRHKVKATWFVLGWVADHHSDLIQEIMNEGHEIACHSYYHRRISTLTREEFEKDTQMAIDALIKAVGVRPYGYRAPSWSINPSVPWAFEVLAKLGFSYDSSIFPIKHDIYGMPKGPRTTFKMKIDNDNTLFEIPASTYRFMGKNYPIAGGGYLRHSPYWFTKMMIKKSNKKGQPVVAYIHPWELDSDPPKISGLSKIQNMRMYGSVNILARKFDKLLGDFEFTTMNEYIQQFRKRTIGFY
ncbi:MAG: polysaccharide deacetylase family protein [Candidatus Zixiibacteriota bacterium]|nr:MAG: polysaccharide deacetylase family protein [candidate division Zixibacteria bacterium]